MSKGEVKEPPKIAQSRAVQAVLETLDERELKAGNGGPRQHEAGLTATS